MNSALKIEAPKNQTKMLHNNHKIECMLLNQTIKLSLISFNDDKKQHLSKPFFERGSYQNTKKIWIQFIGDACFSSAFQAIFQHDWSSIEHFWCMNSQDNKITSLQISHFVKSNWPKLLTLNLMDHRIGDQGIFLILGKNWRELKEMNLGNNLITSIGLKSIPQWKAIKLLNLKLNQNNIKSQGVKLLVKSCLPELKQLNLTKCNIGNQGAKHITKGDWPKLQQICLYKNGISQGLADLLVTNNWKQMKKIESGEADTILNLVLMATCWKGRIRIDSNAQNREFKKQYKKITDSKFV